MPRIQDDMFGAQTGPPRRSNRIAGWTHIIALTSPLVSLSVLASIRRPMMCGDADAVSCY